MSHADKFLIIIYSVMYLELIISISSLNLSTCIFGCLSNLYWMTGLDKRVNYVTPYPSARHNTIS